MSVKAVTQIRKRDGSIAPFDEHKIIIAIDKAAESVEAESPGAVLKDAVIGKIQALKGIPTVEQIQDVVEEVLIEHSYAKIAKAYILYRQKQNDLREQKKKVLGQIDDSGLSPTALWIAKQRYLQRKKDSVETPKEMFQRVAKAAAKGEKKKEFWESQFKAILENFQFIPGGRILAGAGTGNAQLQNCFVIPVEDKLEAILTAVHDAVIIQKHGGGTGFSLSQLRPRGTAATGDSRAMGPVHFLHYFNQSSNLISKTGGRKASNMGSLSISHPNIIEFITAKDKEKSLSNFNISVELTDEFMDALANNKMFDLVDPRTEEVKQKIQAKKLFSLLGLMAWKTGDPGVLFIDEINRKNPLPELGRIATTDPCGENPMLAYENCPVGSINITKFLDDKNTINLKKLQEVIGIAVRFLDNMIDESYYPIEKTKEMALLTRRIGLGLMGFGDLLYCMEIPYNSDEALQLAEKLMSFIQKTSHEESQNLAKEKGSFKAWKKSIYAKHKKPMRNCALTSLAPTGTISIIAETSSGIEPNYALSYVRKAIDNTELVFVNKILEQALKDEGIYSSEIIKKIGEKGSVKDMDEIPPKIKKVFVTTYDISPKWHVKMQATFQKYVDGAISKTVNLPTIASEKEVEEVFLLAWKLNCKGVTVYRNGCYEEQVLDLIQ